ncbi:MAG: septum formation inhibitor Maf [Bacteroidetes bacterium]|nr:septum formation inhibitor Maf [Bacteroidota bacterium]
MIRQAKPLVLASRSPRRILLLKQIGLSPEIVPSEIGEEIDQGSSPADNAMRLAHAKAMDVGRRLQNAIVIGADTIVVLDGKYLGKPSDPTEAVQMLEMLSGRTHSVVTGLAILDRPSNRSLTDFEETKVTFRSLPQDEIETYVAGGSPMDKAGAYGIQDDYGAVFVSRIEGCYYNVVGLPLSKLLLLR